ncbi:V-type ATP synthase subunit F [Candidatus Woesearchaeota archaeon]|nr:V-type ATP synthase subunit F [Candidatus Woesearchaeota archaeon]
MAELAVVGNNEFVMGFQLIGIKKVFEGESAERLKDCFSDALKDEEIGILVTNDRSLKHLDTRFRRTIENSQNPVVVVLSIEAGAQENLREMIKKAIGIDLFAK